MPKKFFLFVQFAASRYSLVHISSDEDSEEMKKWKKQPKNTRNAFFACFRAYVRQPHDHISWATPMPFASINSTKPRTNPWNFHKKYWELAELENEVFLSRPLWNFFFKKIFFCFISIKTSSPFIWGIIYFCTMDGFFRILEKTSSELKCTRLYEAQIHELMTRDLRIQMQPTNTYLVFCRISSEDLGLFLS